MTRPLWYVTIVYGWMFAASVLLAAMLISEPSHLLSTVIGGAV